MSDVVAIEAPAPDTAEPAASVYELIRDDIISGRLTANQKLIVADLAERFGTSTNPVREALHQLRGEGFVVMTPNRGARVRPMGADFIRDIYEIEVLIEPMLTRWFVRIATDEDIKIVEDLCVRMEQINYSDPPLHGELDTQFHHAMYHRHYNRHAVDLWWKHREILKAMSRRYPTSMARRVAVLKEHRDLLEAIKAHDEERAGAIVALHVEGSGKHIIGQMTTTPR
ncbi:MAG: GntR family transcriptional regulator [Hyphomicrobiales bacterium]|nr:MAG: GntR family transcriptional regulator [Hyphomicrobiales bacterium]